MPSGIVRGAPERPTLGQPPPVLACRQGRVKTRATLWPPKPNALFNAAGISM